MLKGPLDAPSLRDVGRGDTALVIPRRTAGEGVQGSFVSCHPSLDGTSNVKGSQTTNTTFCHPFFAPVLLSFLLGRFAQGQGIPNNQCLILYGCGVPKGMLKGPLDVSSRKRGVTKSGKGTTNRPPSLSKG